METIHRDQPLATNTITLGFSFKFALVYVPSNGTRTNADRLRGHVGRHPSRHSRRVRAICPRVSACVVLSHMGDTRPLGLGTKGFRRQLDGSGDTSHRLYEDMNTIEASYQDR